MQRAKTLTSTALAQFSFWTAEFHCNHEVAPLDRAILVALEHRNSIAAHVNL